MPISFSVRMTRIAISPRLATSTFSNMAAESRGPCGLPTRAGPGANEGPRRRLRGPKVPLGFAHPDHLVAARADAHEPDRGASVLGDEVEVVTSLLGLVRLAAAGAAIADEAPRFPVPRLGRVPHRLVIGQL